MKLLYLASNPPGNITLNLVTEITELQRSASEKSADPVSVVFLPDLKFEDLAKVLGNEKPDILHFSAHGDDEHLYLSNDVDDEIAVTAEIIRRCLNPTKPPKLIYLSACNSRTIARELTDIVPMTIGSTAPISNRAARTASMAFYNAIFQGDTVKRAFEISESMMAGASKYLAAVELFSGDGIDPAKQILQQIPRLVAEFPNSIIPKRGPYNFELGVTGCPSWVRQVVFFTDDPTYIREGYETIEDDLCEVTRDPPVGGAVWGSFPWKARGDVMLYATAVGGDGNHFTVSGTLCEALTTRYNSKTKPPSAKDFQRVMMDLKSRDGSRR